MRNPGMRGWKLSSILAVLLSFGCDEGPFLVSGVVVGSLSVSPAALVLAEEESDSLFLQVFDDQGLVVAGQNASWISEDLAVATVEGSAAGAAVTGVGAGSTRIQVTVAGVSGFANVEVFASAFDIEIRYVGTGPTATQRAAFDDAAAFWRTAVVGDLVDFNADIAAGDCGGVSAPAVQEIIDDLIIFVEFADIDGAGGTLGSAAPCWLRSADLTPFIGSMMLDNADVANLEAGGNLGTTIRHEMGHVLGIGTLWGTQGLLANPSDPAMGGVVGADTHFTGTLAIAAFDGAGGSGYVGAKVPVENDNGTFGTGSLDGHWRESVFATELMTPSINGGVANPMSLVTVQSLADMGYQVNTAAAEAYTVANPLLSLQGPPLGQILLVGDISWGPIGVMDENGRVVRVIER